MKIANTLIISSLLTFSLSPGLSAADLEERLSNMNQTLQSQIDTKINLSLRSMNESDVKGMVFNASASLEDSKGHKQRGGRT